ncbi:MAG: chorismate synthase [Phycisphaerales bacterium]|nr:chorismate synthase [Phycisphaerales bacterium]
MTFQTAGESHGPASLAFLQGMPAGLVLDLGLVNAELARRQGGYGRGGRQRIERDEAVVLAGVRNGVTTGAPIVLQVVNRDSRLDDRERTPPVHRPRPGHADLAGATKWLTTDCRNTLERASARETAARTAAGATARCLLREVGIEVFGFVRSVRDARTEIAVTIANWRDLRSRRDESEVYCPDAKASEEMIARIRQAKVDRDTVGGLVEAHVFGCPIGLGSCVQWDLRLDARLAGAVMGIQAFKAVEIGLGLACAARAGSEVHDPIAWDAHAADEPNLGFVRPTNNAGGLEGGMTNGMPVVVRGAMKPISTLLRGMPSVDLKTREAQHSDYERSDVCAVSAASVVMENVVAFEIARAFLEKFAGDTMDEVRDALAAFLSRARALGPNARTENR